MNILFIHTAFIGDMVLLTSHLMAVKKKFPEANIWLVCNSVSSELLKLTPVPIEIISYDKRNRDKGIAGFIRILKKIRAIKPDIVITPHRYLKSSMFTIFSKSKIRIGYEIAPLSYFFSSRVRYEKNIHEIDRLNKLLEPLGIQNEFSLPKLNVSEIKLDGISENLSQEKMKKVVVAPGSVWFTKRYPVEKFSVLVSLLIKSGYKVILIGSKSEKELSEKIVSDNLTIAENIIDTTGKYTLTESAKIISLCDLTISNDSSPQHISMAVGVPVITIYGATIPEFGFYPRGPKDRFIETKGLTCRPCGIHGGNKCPIQTFDCMNSIEPKNILKLVDETLKN